MTDSEVRELIQSAILAHERRVGFISGIIGGLWFAANIGVVAWLLFRH